MTKLIIAALIIIAAVVIFLSCKTTKYTPTDFPDEQITFGTGGGFSGIVNDYTLLSNGQLFKRSSVDNRFVEVQSASRDAATQAFKNYDFLGIGDMSIDKPGNLYYFIQYKGKDSQEHKLVWGDDQTTIDDKLKTFYENLSALIPKED